MKYTIKRWDNGLLIAEIEADNLRKAVEQANKSRANLSRADLSLANLSRADLSLADLSGADLSGANLSGANLSGADLSWADLSWANLSGANLSRANLSWANLSRANLSRADLSLADLSLADLSRANLSWANLSGANLSRADLSLADLSLANLSRANISVTKGIEPWRVTPLMFLFDQPGFIRAYKLVNSESEGPFNGGIRYEIGQEVVVENADADPTIPCAAGINLATLDWCLRGWRPGHRIFIAEFEAKDISAIPIATDGKFRVRRCRIVGEKDLTGLIPQLTAETKGTVGV